MRRRLRRGWDPIDAHIRPPTDQRAEAAHRLGLVLQVLFARGRPLSRPRIAELTGIPPMAVWYALDRLRTAGLVELHGRGGAARWHALR